MPRAIKVVLQVQLNKQLYRSFGVKNSLAQILGFEVDLNYLLIYVIIAFMP